MKLEIAKGTRDFSPKEEMLRQNVINKLRKVFQLYGFSPIETPLLERYEVLSAKFTAGEESDAMKEVFTLTDQGGRKLGLRYELTFPLARYIGMNPQIRLPFKRYQIGRVYRDGPIKLGRYREFWQCDVDIAGCDKLIADAEIVSILQRGFKELGLDVSIEVNNRVLLNDILAFAGVEKEKQEGVLITLDKLKKVAKEGVKEELQSKSIDAGIIEKILDVLSVTGSNSEKLDSIKEKIGETKGIKETREFLSYINDFNVDVEFCPSLVRGLAYYTGPIFEVFLKDSEITSSVAAGGRWDNMIGSFLGTDAITPATGVAFGLEPITEELKRREILTKECVTDIFVIPIGDTAKKCVEIIQQLRENNVSCDMDFLKKGISKNLDYANKMNIPFVILVGEDELKAGKLKLKNMSSGEESLVSISEVIRKMKGEKNEQ
ncbi:MAG: histidine--tRNA ligase [Candidatus Woesearchaeota archaeon]|jgi:histidyl-tRNA synthetase|nr:histidine--tRNA ligase [Candidatus Woesearchaeota archaeon]|tara:strand:+ start:820 stop:2121 length:1302 start_codon:yes stop_codon:yes gene_type:complete